MIPAARVPSIAVAAVLCAHLAVAIAGCERGGDVPDTKRSPAAQLARRTTLDDLATITLAHDAEERLGLATTPARTVQAPRPVEVAGEVVQAAGRAVDTSAPISGRLIAPSARRTVAGMRVKTGDLLFWLAPLAAVDRDLRARLERDRDVARAELARANAQRARAEQMLADRTGSQRAVEEARAAADAARANAKVAEATRARVEGGSLEADVRLPIRAPFSGRVGAMAAVAGQSVAAGQVLLTIVGGDLLVRAAVPAAEAHRVHRDQSARVRFLGATPAADDIDAPAVEGPPTADPVRATVDRYFGLPRGLRLVPGERVHVTLSASDKRALVAVPATAIVHDANGGSWVYVRGDAHRYRRRRVTVVRSKDGQALVEPGLAPEEPVVSAGALELYGYELGADR